MQKTRILILAEAYPSPKSHKFAFVHSRVCEYIKRGILVKVLSFEAKESYQYEGVDVVSHLDFDKNYKLSNFDLIASHAPNLIHHVTFILKNIFSIHKVIFFIHGHEVLHKSRYYPPEFSFNTRSLNSRIANEVYDTFKRIFLHIFFTLMIRYNKAHFVFVSNWMFKKTLQNLFLSKEILEDHFEIIPNPVNEVFINEPYSPNEFEADFVTIRSLDIPKYGIDILVSVCQKYPQFKFAVYGQGSYFNHFEKPSNLIVHQQSLQQKTIPSVLKKYKFAFMPTKLDAQGVMACEMAVTGIPLISSDHEACVEFLADLPNVGFINNENIDLHFAVKNLQAKVPERLVNLLNPDKITKSEIELFEKLK